jgi:hypothetical protein
MFGCCSYYSQATKKKDAAAREWIRDWAGRFDWTEILTWKSVAASKVPRAEEILQDKPSVEITEEMARDLADRTPSTGWTGTPYLIRAVGDERGKRPQEVFVKSSGDVWVGGGANSRCAVPMQRRAVITWLREPPNQVYVTFVAGK